MIGELASPCQSSIYTAADIASLCTVWRDVFSEASGSTVRRRASTSMASLWRSVGPNSRGGAGSAGRSTSRIGAVGGAEISTSGGSGGASMGSGGRGMDPMAPGSKSWEAPSSKCHNWGVAQMRSLPLLSDEFGVRVSKLLATLRAADGFGVASLGHPGGSPAVDSARRATMRGVRWTLVVVFLHLWLCWRGCQNVSRLKCHRVVHRSPLSSWSMAKHCNTNAVRIVDTASCAQRHRKKHVPSPTRLGPTIRAPSPPPRRPTAGRSGRAS